MKPYVLRERYQACHKDLVGPSGQPIRPRKEELVRISQDNSRNRKEIQLMNSMLEHGTELSDEEWDKLCEKRAGKICRKSETGDLVQHESTPT